MDDCSTSAVMERKARDCCSGHDDRNLTLSRDRHGAVPSPGGSTLARDAMISLLTLKYSSSLFICFFTLHPRSDPRLRGRSLLILHRNPPSPSQLEAYSYL